MCRLSAHPTPVSAQAAFLIFVQSSGATASNRFLMLPQCFLKMNRTNVPNVIFVTEG